jgi:hypothetical protein
MPLVSVISNRKIVTCFALQSLKIKFTNITKMSCVHFDIQRSNVQVVDKQLANASYTKVTMAFSTKLGRTFSTKVFLDGKIIHGHDLYDNV